MSRSGSSAGPQAAIIPHLTPREIQVLKLIGEGYSTKKIADVLGVAFKTAACHRSRLMAKVGVHETVTLIRWAIRQGLIAP